MLAPVKHKHLNAEKSRKAAYEKHLEYLALGREAFKQKHSAKEYRKWLSMFRTYVTEYKTKKASTAVHKIDYNGKCLSVSKWCNELGICKWSLYALVKSGKTFQEAFDMLLADPKHAPR